MAFSSTTRYTGLSGIDTASMVDAMMKVESLRYDSLYKKNMSFSYKQEAYQSVGNKLVDIQSSKFDILSSGSFRKNSTFVGKTSSVTDASGNASNAVTITTSSSSSNSNYKISVDQLATNDSYSIKGSGSSTATRGVGADPNANLTTSDSLSVTVDGVTKTVSFTDEQVSAINSGDGNAAAKALTDGINAAFGEGRVNVANNGGKLSISATSGHSFKIANTTGSDALQVLGFGNPVSAVTANAGQTASGSIDMASITTADKFSIAVDGVGYSVGFTQKQIDDINSFPESDRAQMAAEALTQNLDKLTSFGGAGTAVTITADASGRLSFNALEGHTIDRPITNSSGDLLGKLGFTVDTSASISSGKTSTTTMSEMFGTDGSPVTINGVEVKTDGTVDQFMADVNAIGSVSMKYNSQSGNFTLTSKDTGAANAINITGSATNVGILTADHKVVAQDAKVTVDGDEVYYGTNNITLDDGTKLQLNSVTTGELSVKVSEDTQYTANAVKDFIDTYNQMLQAIYDQTETSRPKSASGSTYDPLTDEERSAMSETDLKKWDENAQKGLLYRDGDLRSIETKLRDNMSKSVVMADGTKINMGDLGISLNTKDISKRGLLTVDEDKLNAAIEKYGSENIASAFTGADGYAERIDATLQQTVGREGTLTKKVGLKSSPFYMVENPMSRQETANARALVDLQKRLSKKEDRYYAMFSNMETQIQKSNQQLAALG